MIFRPNPTFAAEMARTPRMQRVLLEAAQAIADEGRNAVPVGDDPRRGHIRDRIRATQQHGDTRTEIDDPFGHLAEWGSVNNPAYAPLRRGVEAAGLRFREK